jgi:peptidoglycan/LPS O-acetylase OafA/YrhL
MSYSLYLVHQPMVGAFAALLGQSHRSSPRFVFLVLVLLIPVEMTAAWLLFVLVERYSVVPPRDEALTARLLFPQLPWGRRRLAASPGVDIPSARPPASVADQPAARRLGEPLSGDAALAPAPPTA